MLFKLKHTIIIVGCFFYTWTFLIGQNILSNGDFEQITSVWDTKFGYKYVNKWVSKTIEIKNGGQLEIQATSGAQLIIKD